MIWDPFLAAAEAATGARTLADGTGLVDNHQFYLASRSFVETQPEDRRRRARRSSARSTTGPRQHPGEVAEQLAPAIGIPAPVLEVALKRQAYGVKPLTDGVIAEQQKIADTFLELGLIPKPITDRRRGCEGPQS